MTNRVDGQGLADVAARAGEAADSAVAEPDFPGLAPPESPPDVEGYDDAVAAIGAEEQAHHARPRSTRRARSVCSASSRA